MLALALARHFGVSLVPQATGNYAATLTQVMTKQVDIGFAQAPFVLDAVEDGRIRLVAKGADMPEAGQLLSYGAVGGAAARRIASIVDRILRGAKPGDIPIEQPSEFELVINPKTANALALTIPQSLQLRAEVLKG